VLRMRCATIAVVSLLVSAGPSAAQGWSLFDGLFGGEGSYERRGYGRRGYYREDWDDPEQRRERSPRSDSGSTRNGGARPRIAPQVPPTVAFTHDYPLNSIVIDTGGRKLYYVLPDGRAYAYAISVGREGFNWTGSEVISRKQEWPDWHPPAEMRERDRSLPVKMTGGLKNPLGALALYLGDTLYRIHGTNDAKSIGRAASSGCFRMLNAHVLHLASIAEIGTQVAVVATLPGQPTQPKVSAINGERASADRRVWPLRRLRRSARRTNGAPPTSALPSRSGLKPSARSWKPRRRSARRTNGASPSRQKRSALPRRRGSRPSASSRRPRRRSARRMSSGSPPRKKQSAMLRRSGLRPSASSRRDWRRSVNRTSSGPLLWYSPDGRRLRGRRPSARSANGELERQPAIIARYGSICSAGRPRSRGLE
jgi:lipoprotein-anchoring transpeptidase ErfK/SrfK